MNGPTGGVPPLIAKKPGFGVRALGIISSGVRRTSAQIGPYTAWWNEQNQTAARAAGPLWVVVGDSTSIGIGASAPHRGYVGRLLGELRRQEPSWRVINLAMSGARADDGLKRQLPTLERLSTEPDLVTMCLGTNDVFWDRSPDLRENLRSLVARLPAQSYVATAAGRSERARSANRALRSATGDFGHVSVNPWAEPGHPPGERLAEDRFHPNDLGYAYMAQPFARAIGVPGPAIDQN